MDIPTLLGFIIKGFIWALVNVVHQPVVCLLPSECAISHGIQDCTDSSNPSCQATETPVLLELFGGFAL